MDADYADEETQRGVRMNSARFFGYRIASRVANPDVALGRCSTARRIRRSTRPLLFHVDPALRAARRGWPDGTTSPRATVCG